MLRIGHVARNRDDALEAGDGSLERGRSSGVDDDPPFPLRECADEGEAKAARGAGDDADGHCDHAAASTGERSRATTRS